MSKKEKNKIIRIVIAGIMLAILMILEHMNIIPFMGIGNYNILELCLYMVPFLLTGFGVITSAISNISRGQVFDENFLMLVASIGAIIVSEFSEGVAVMIFYSIGELFENRAVDKSRKSIKEMMDIAPEYANVFRDGEILKVDPEEVGKGETIVIKPGEKVPLDGIVIEGESSVDTSSLTGESVPRKVRVDDEIVSGSINEVSVLKVVTTKEYEDSTVSKILDLVENAGAKKGKTEKFITKFARVYTPIVVFSALALFIIPSLVTGEWFMWLERACTFLVVSCPCALVISVPLAFFAGIGKASKIGVLVKGGVYMENAAKLKTVVFDKTGTLTRGVFEITELNPASGVSNEELLRIAAHAEEMSNHPIAQSIKNKYTDFGFSIDTQVIKDNREVVGRGIEATVDGLRVLAGNSKLMEENGIEYDVNEKFGTVCYIAQNGRYIGNIVISDIVKTEAKEALKDLRKSGIEKVVMLTGDRKAVGEHVAKQLGIDTVYTDLLPGDKVTKVEELIEESGSRGKLAFVGDGINDTPVLARADVGFAMGAIGSDSAIEAADVVIMDDDITKIAKMKNISKHTISIAMQNIIFALTVKIAVLILSVFGITNMWIAVFADVGVAMLCILNSFRELADKTGVNSEIEEITVVDEII